MDADEKLNALKAAYADIILNLSKEAACRVMASERKAWQYEHELKLTKEEALRLLMRLKQMMDSKINEGKLSSLNQQKKIVELEAQLEEAEDIVRDLREELSIVHDELEKVKKENSRLVNEAESAFSRQVAIDNHIYSYQSSTLLSPKSCSQSAIASDATRPYLSQTNECSKCYTKTVCMCGSFLGNRDMPSTTMSCKESGLYRKGCTQRIHACEMNHLDRELSLLGETDKMKNEKNEKQQEEGGDMCKPLASAAETLNAPKNKRLADVKIKGVNSFLKKRKRSNRKRKTLTPMSEKHPDIFQKADQLPELSVPIKHHNFSDKPLKVVSRLPQDKVESQKKEEIKLDEHRELTEDMLPLIEETLGSEDSRSSDCETEVGKVDVPSNSSLDAAKGLFNKPKRERVIKITFQRKRKRQASCEFGMNASLEAEKRISDKKNGDQILELPKSSLATKRLRDSKSSSVLESSRDSRRLAQVARQLISLSEKKWWR